MSDQEQSKREILKEKVVSLVKDFVKTEGGITQDDLQVLFGNPNDPRKTKEFMTDGVSAALGELPIFFSEDST
jgi:hypothetical protein